MELDDLLLDILFEFFRIGAALSSDKQPSEEYRKKRGWLLTEAEIQKFRDHGCDGKTLREISLLGADGNINLFHMLYLCRKGIIYIQFMNCDGKIQGKEQDCMWKEQRSLKSRRFANPLTEMKQKIAFLQPYTFLEGKSIPVFSLIVFPDDCNIKNIRINVPKCYVVLRKTMCQAMSDILSYRDVMNDEEFNVLCEKIHSGMHGTENGIYIEDTYTGIHGNTRDEA